MESEASKALITRSPSPAEPILTPYLHEDILRHIATFLDFHSLRQFRLVSHEWDSACLPILMKRGTYDLTWFCRRCQSPDESFYKGAIHYSSWKITHSVYESAKLLADNGMWQNVKSLTIHENTPVSREFHSWAWETIQTRCPNLQELTFIFPFVAYLSKPKLSSEVVSDYEQAIQGLPNASFPKISNLRNLTSVQFKGIYDKATAYLAENLLQACPNLRHLSFSQIHKRGNADDNVFRILKYLKRNPSLLINLQSFSFSIGRYFSHEPDEELVGFSNFRRESGFTEYFEQNKSSFLPLLSKNLTKLFWDSPFHLDGQFLPGVLTPSVASSLVQLCLNGEVEDFGEKAGTIIFPIKVSFPTFPRLRALKLGLTTCHSISVPELIDSAPNLYVLEIKRVICGRNELNSVCWRGMEHSYSNPEHIQLKIFCTDVAARNLSDIGNISTKFPNLVELRVGNVKGFIGFDTFLNFVQSRHPKLQRLSWIASKEYTLYELFSHLVRVPQVLPDLNVYSLRNHENLHRTDNLLDMEYAANRTLIDLPSSSHSNPGFVINLMLKCLTCLCKPKEEEPPRQIHCMNCYLKQFIRRHDLPIAIPSKLEIEEMWEKYDWNHRFTSSWIYK
jgi:hypothetical protein